MAQHIDYGQFRSTLLGLVNPKGEHIIQEQKTVDVLWNQGADLEDLVALFADSIGREGCERFFSEGVAYFLQKGYTTKDLLVVAKLEDHNGKPILESSNDFWDFVKIKGSIDDAVAVAKVKDSEGRIVFRREDYIGHNGGFEGITDLLEAGGDAQKVQELVEIIGADGKSVFQTPRDIIRFIENNGTKTYAQRLVALRDCEDKQIFNEFDIGLYRQNNGSVKYTQELSSLRDTAGHTVFSRGEDIVDFHERKYGLKAARKFANLLDNNGNTVFRDGSDIVPFLRASGTVDKVKDYIAIVDDEGRTYFNGYEIALLRKNKVSAGFAASLAKKGLNAETIMYHSKLGLTENDTTFSNSGKPKALILYPAGNPPDFIGAQVFSEDDTFEFFRRIFGSYDVRLRAISTVDEMYQEIEQNADINLLILGGHGTKQSLTFGESRPKYGLVIGEESSTLTVNTKGLKTCLERLPPDAVIFLDSCCNGEGRENERNMANYVAECAPGRKVISGAEVFNAGKITINQMVPLDLSIRACYTYRDCTYVNRR